MIARCSCGWLSDQPSPDAAAFAEATHRRSCFGPGRQARFEELCGRLVGQLGEMSGAVEDGEFVTAHLLSQMARETVAELVDVERRVSGRTNR